MWKAAFQGASSLIGSGISPLTNTEDETTIPTVAGNGRHPVTRDELKAEPKRFVTKEDLRAELKAALKNYATKKNLERFATKKDLERFATKEDLRSYAKQETVDRLALEIVNIKDELARMNERMATKDDINRITNTLDYLVLMTEKGWNKLTVHDERLRALEERCPAVPPA